MNEPPARPDHPRSVDDRLRFLDESLVAKIDQALCRVGEFGEVVLVVVKGRLRFIQVTQSENLHES